MFAILIAIGTITMSPVFYSFLNEIDTNVEYIPIVILTVELKNNDTLTLEHNGGEDLLWDELKILINGKEISNNNYSTGNFFVGEEQNIMNKCLPNKTYKVKVVYEPSNIILMEEVINFRLEQ